MEFRQNFFLIIIYLISALFSIVKGSVLRTKIDYKIINSFGAPGPSTQELAWSGSYIWVADDSTNLIYKLDPVDGTTLKEIATPGSKARGLTWDGSYLWCSDSDSLKIFKVDSLNGIVISSIPAPVSDAIDAPEDQLRGLTWDGEFLYSCFEDRWSSQIVKIDTNDLSHVTFAYTIGFPKGLAFDGIYVWNCSNGAGVRLGWVAQYEHSTGLLKDIFDTPGYYPTGLAYDGKYFWLADSKMDTIYQIEFIKTNIEIKEMTTHAPESFLLYQNYPNPFNQETIIRFTIASQSHIRLCIFDINGKVIKIMVDEQLKAGLYTTKWNGMDNSEKIVASGIYFFKIVADNFIDTKKMILVK